jgi:uncharacterized protein (DUF58 family)
MPRPAAASNWIVGALLVLAIALVPFSYAIVAVAALALRIRLARALQAERLLIVIANLIALPFVWGAVFPTRPEMAALTLIGAPWFLERLRATLRRDVRLDQFIPVKGIARQPTRLLGALTIALAAALVAALLFGHAIIAFSAGVVLGILGFIIGVSFLRLRPQFLVEAASVRVLAGESAEAEVSLSGHRSTGQIHMGMEVPWADVAPNVADVDGGPLALSLHLTPPLAGAGPVMAEIAWVDPWGLTGLTFRPVLAQLRVIPRAAYAAWLARRYLDASRAGGSSAAIILQSGLQGAARRGLDYYGARHYEPGDTLRDVLWKKMLKAKQLVVKDRRDEQAQTAIIAVRLAGRDPDEADRLAYHLLMTALTLAQEGVPVAFAAYGPEEFHSATPALAPRQTVQHALRLSEQVKVIPGAQRLLQPAQPARLRRTISRLRQASSAPAHRLADVLDFELRAHRARARRHPATAAILQVVARVQTPAIVVVISSLVDDAEILNFSLENLVPRGFQRMDLLAVSS